MKIGRMKNKKTKSINLEHQRLAFEILGILASEEGFQTSDKILNQLRDLHNKEDDGLEKKEKNLEAKTINRAKDTIHDILGTQLIESKKNKGYRLKKNLPNDDWVCAALNRYNALVEIQSLDYIFEPLVHVSGRKSLLHLILCKLAKDKSHLLSFDYTKYEDEKSQRREIQVYALAQRDTKFIILGKDKKDGVVKNFFLSQMDNLKIDFDSSWTKDESFSVQTYFANSLGNYKGNLSREVTIRFSPESKKFIYKEFFQKSAKIEETPEGFLLKVHSYSMQEVFNLVSKFMDYAELISPTDWREKYYQKLEKHLAKHKKM
jgi:predicted DNA-binding transcriptional regulator YafY